MTSGINPSVTRTGVVYFMEGVINRTFFSYIIRPKSYFVLFSFNPHTHTTTNKNINYKVDFY